MKTVFAYVRPCDVLNLATGRYLPEVVHRWGGKRKWHDSHYEPLRDLMERTYAEAFDALTGHYTRLEEDVRANGIRNPVALRTGRPVWRLPSDVPPDMREMMFCERLGGSRLWVACKLGVLVPAVVNDTLGVVEGRAVTSTAELRACFQDPPRKLMYSPTAGAAFSHMPYTHMPEWYRFSDQTNARRVAVMKTRVAAAKWMRENDLCRSPRSSVREASTTKGTPVGWRSKCKGCRQKHGLSA